MATGNTYKGSTLYERARDLYYAYEKDEWAAETTSDEAPLTGLDRWNACVAQAAQDLAEENEALKAENEVLKAENEALRAELAALKAEAEAEAEAETENENENENEVETDSPAEVEVEWTLTRHAYKGTGKAWAALVEVTKGGGVVKGSYKFLDHYATSREGNRTFYEYKETLPVGQPVLLNDVGTKRSDDRRVLYVHPDGELRKDRP